MSKKFIKTAAVVAPAIMALSAAPADAKVLLMGDGGWEVSFDGLVNGNYTYTTTEELPLNAAGTSATTTGNMGTRQGGWGQYTGRDQSRIVVGLLPAVWGVNIKAPTIGGLDMKARLGLYPNIANDTTKNRFGNGAYNTHRMDIREIFFTVDGSFGQVLVGRTLSQFEGKAILSDMTLFGNGISPGAGGGPSLGRIGVGYVYPNFNARIQYTTPDFNGVKVSVGIYDPSGIGGQGSAAVLGIYPSTAGSLAAAATPTRAGTVVAHEGSSPRFEGELSYAGNLQGVSTSLWASGLYQNAQLSTANQRVAAQNLMVINNATHNGTPIANWAAAVAAVDDDVNAWGAEIGLQLGYAGFTLTASGYTGEALGITLPLDTASSLDAVGEERDNFGYYVQGVYAFGQGTSIGLSYGENNQSNTEVDEKMRLVTEPIEDNSMWDVLLWHDINKNLRVIAEWSLTEATWMDGSDQEAHQVGVGSYFFW